MRMSQGFKAYSTWAKWALQAHFLGCGTPFWSPLGLMVGSSSNAQLMEDRSAPLAVEGRGSRIPKSPLWIRDSSLCCNLTKKTYMTEDAIWKLKSDTVIASKTTDIVLIPRVCFLQDRYSQLRSLKYLCHTFEKMMAWIIFLRLNSDFESLDHPSKATNFKTFLFKPSN